MNDTPLMKCGHSANAKDKDGNPVCVICVGLDAGATVVDEAPPSLEGREAKCGQCGHRRPSEFNLPFFEHNPNHETDGYYCGCRGWN